MPSGLKAREGSDPRVGDRVAIGRSRVSLLLAGLRVAVMNGVVRPSFEVFLHGKLPQERIHARRPEENDVAVLDGVPCRLMRGQRRQGSS